MGEDATEHRFKTEAPDYTVLHLALHGESDTNSFYNSRLIFKQASDTTNDGSLYMYELLKLKLNANLAVLSACESGVGKLSKGEGVYSIARGFIQAGCPSVVMSLWKVNDAATAQLMAGFYQYLSAGQTTDVAIRTAKLTYIRESDRRLAHPSNWASFVNLGNTTLEANQNKNAVWRYSIWLVCLLAIFALLTYRFSVKRKPAVSK